MGGCPGGRVVTSPADPVRDGNGEVEMSVRRHAARWATVGALLGGLVAAPASPALAEGDRVGLRSAASFTAGGSPGVVAIEVRKRTEGCVLLRTALGLRVEGLRADQVRVEVAVGRRWTPVPVSGGGGAVATAQVAAVDRPLCKGKGATVRYRVAFADGAVGGRLELAGRRARRTARCSAGPAGRPGWWVRSPRRARALPASPRRPPRPARQ